LGDLSHVASDLSNAGGILNLALQRDFPAIRQIWNWCADVY